MITEKELMKLAKTRPDMACIFQTPFKQYERFTVYNTYVICYTLDRITKYKTTSLRDDIIYLDKTDANLDIKIQKLGYNPEENVIYTFYLEK